MKTYIEIILSKIVTKCTRCRRNIIIGSKSMLYWRSKCVVSKGGKIHIGQNVSVGRTGRKYHVAMPFYTTLLADVPDSVICVGDNTRLNGVYIHAHKKITIGKNCVMASGVNIIDANGHQTYSDNRTVGQDEPKEVEIGNNVWIGLNATILKGTIIGDNCIVSAGSVVRGTFPQDSIIVGNPARIVKRMTFNQSLS